MKKLLIITLILSAVFCFGCSSKNDDSSNMVKLNKVDISTLLAEDFEMPKEYNKKANKNIIGFNNL